MAYTRADLELARRHVRAAARWIADLRQDIETAKQLDHPTELAERLLATTLATEALMQAHLEQIERSLAVRDADRDARAQER